MPTIKKLQFANGTDVTEPTDLSIESSTDHLKTYADDSAYVADNGPASAGDIYINTTMNTARLYAGGQWWSVVIKENAIIVDDNFKLVDNGDNTKVGKFDVSNVPTGQTKTFAVPAIATASDVLVTQDATQELKNKTIDGNLNTLTNLDFGTLSGEVNPQNGGTGISNPAGATLTRTGAFDLNITCTAETDVTMPVSGTLATLDDIDVSNLTGTVAPDQGGLGTDASAFNGVVKADGAGNFSASAVTNTDISATAAIARSKVASGTANHIVINDGTGVLSSEATLAKSRGGSGQDNTNLTFPSTGTLATLAGSETLSFKTLFENTVDNFLAFNEEAAAPATPASGKVAVYAKSDSKIYKKDSTGAESEIGAGGSGTGRNYLQDWFDGTKPIGTIQNTTDTGNRSSLANWAASDVTKLTLLATFNTTNPLRQTSDYKITHVAIGASFIETPQFVLDIADLGKPVSVEFDLTGVVTANDFDVCVVRFNTGGFYQEKISVAGTASTGSPASAQLPTGTTKFRGFFVAGSTSTDRYAVRIRRLSATAAYDVQIDSLFVGPQSLAQGAVVTASQQYIPSASVNQALGTLTNVDVSYARHGEFLILEGRFDLGTLSGSEARLALPSGLTVGSYTQDTRIVGTWAENNTSANNPKIGNLLASSGHNYLRFSLLGEQATTSSPLTPINANAGLSSLNTMVINARVKISQWSSGTTTLADRAVEEYAFNTSTSTTTSDTSSFGYGPNGWPIASITAQLDRTVRFQTAILPTDSIILEIKDDSTGNWTNVASGLGGNPLLLQRQSSTYYGLGISSVGSTDVVIRFGQYWFPNAATYAQPGQPWSSLANFRWRVRKVSGGAAVGFPVSARNIVGDTSGTAVPSGMIGETLTPTYASSGSISSGTTNTEYASVTLSAGVWRLSGNIQVALGATAPSGWTTLTAYIQTTVAAPVDNKSVSGFDSSNSFTFIPGNSNWAFAVPELIVNVSSTTTYRLVVRTAMTTPNSAQHRPDISRLNAVRIA